MSKKEVLNPAVINGGALVAEDINYEEIPLDMMQKGDFVGLKRILSGNDRVKYMGLLLESVEKTIESSRKEAASLKDRGLFGRLTSNNVNDIGNVLGKQNIVIACLYLLMQIQSFSIEACNDMLATLYKEVDKTSENSTEQSSIITQTFKDVLEDYRKRLEKDGIRDKALMKLLKAAENSKDFEASIKDELEKAKSEYKSAVEKIYDLSEKNQKQLSEQLRVAQENCELKISGMEKSNKEAMELINKRLKYTIFAFILTTVVLLSVLIIGFFI